MLPWIPRMLLDRIDLNTLDGRSSHICQHLLDKLFIQRKLLHWLLQLQRELHLHFKKLLLFKQSFGKFQLLIDYSESEAQTDPYSPEYVLAPNAEPPELIALSTLKFGAGLPAGMAELEMIERARTKRAWEAALPRVVDKESFNIRLKMMEEMELREWKEREEEINRYFVFFPLIL